MAQPEAIEERQIRSDDEIRVEFRGRHAHRDFTRLEHVFGTDPNVTLLLTSVTAPGVVETYSTFKEIADGVVDARVWGGIHWRTSSVRGRRVGETIGRYAAHHFLRSRDGDDYHNRLGPTRYAPE